MLVLTIAVLAAAAAFNYFLPGNKSPFYPPAAFCAIWAVWLTLVLAVGKALYPLSPETLAIFMLGGVTFSIGGLLAQSLAPPATNSRPRSPRFLKRAIAACAMLFPLYCFWVYRLASEYPAATFLLSSRRAFLALGEGGSEKYNLAYVVFINLLVAMPVIALIAVSDKKSSKRLVVIAVALALLVELLTGAKGGAISLLLSLVCVDWLRSRRIRWKFLLSAAAVTILVFSVLIFAVQGIALGTAVAIYSVGGIVAFDYAVHHPTAISHQTIYEVPVRWLNTFGAHIETPPTPASSFVDIGPGLDDNVFTMYFFYNDFGLPGIAVIMCLLGFALSLLYSRALSGHSIAVVMYGVCFAGLMLSAFSEYFFLQVNNLLKDTAICWFLYRSQTSLADATEGNHITSRFLSSGIAHEQD